MLRWAAGWCRGARRRAALGGGALLLLLLLGAPPPRAQHEARFPHLAPATLAHFLADFSNHADLFLQLDSWAIEEEWNNVTSWHYEVSYTCGARCWGRAALSAHAQLEHSEPRHGAAAAHRLHAADTRCSRPPLLPWPALCEETETETLIEGEGAGSRLQETTWGRCGALSALLGACRGDAQLRDALSLRLRALRAALADRHAAAR